MSAHDLDPPARRRGFLRARTTRLALQSGRIVALSASLALLGACSLLQTPEPPRDHVAVLPVPDARPVRHARRTLTLEELPSSSDLMARLTRDFMLPAADQAPIAAEREWFAAHPDYVTRVLRRGEPYLFHIAEALEARGMPADLALLPVIESAFDPFAYSRGRASGLWQIIPGTGRRLGLKQNWWYDGRRDIIDSTRAALDYLEQLHAQFDGDWLLAVAGYNSGGGNVVRARKRAEAAGRDTDFWGIRQYLPVETRKYVPRLLALRDIVAAPETYGLSLPEIAPEPQFALVETGGQIDLAIAAELAGLDVETLYALNAGFNRWATDPDGPHRLVVPIERAEVLSEALDELGERERVQWTRHRVRSGDTLIQLARRYDTTAAVLREVNGLRGDMIVAGNYLMIPHARGTLADYTQSLRARTARQQNRQRAGSRRTHVVAPGESFWTISRRYGVGIAELAGWNAMAPGDVLNIGRQLVVWQSAPATVAAAGGPGGRTRRVSYVVRQGDSLYSIASRFRITVNELVEWNSISANDYLQPGQRLVMYVDVTQQSS